ncbi:hypothetical protein GGR51DRAFT_433043 [Nemania sp. FL0031]|nr:hypothetical protein GGR51DRAFT_433043 [Nemania sp. FL0031]
MTEIYGNARIVRVWLGDPVRPVNADAQTNITNEELEKAVQDIKRFGKLDDANHLGSVDIGIRNKANLYNLEPLFKLLKSGWFGRRWIVQEVGVAKAVTVHYGDKQFSWEELTHAVALLERIGRDGSIDRLFKLRPDTQHVSEHAGNISALPAYRLIQNVSGLYKKRSNDTRFEARSLEQLVCYLAVFECSNPRDVIYAILGIASDVQPVPAPANQPAAGQPPADQPALAPVGQETRHERVPFEVSYSEDIVDVYMRFLQHAIEKSGSLDIVCRPWAPERIQNKPSWILDVTRKPFRATRRGKMVRHNPDPFVGPAVNRGSFYNASGGCGDKKEKDWFEIQGPSDSKSITVQGFELGKLDDIGDLAVHGSIPTSWLKGANWLNAAEPPPDELWRTLVADRTNAGIEPEPEYPSVIQYAALEKGIQYGINTNEFLHDTDNTAYYEVFRRVQAVVWNRRMVRVNLGEEPCLGLVPAETLGTDLTYIVRGCSVPLVLRKALRKPEEPVPGGSKVKHLELGNLERADLGRFKWELEHLKERDIYELIGECYINNMMDGRALKLKGNKDWDQIEIK